MRSSLVSRTLRAPQVLRTRPCAARSFSTSTRLQVVKPFILADIGEGIREVQIIQWFVQPGARVEQFDKLCEVQSDKASVEITSRFDGVIKKLHYEADEMAFVGKALLDIDIQGEISAEDEAITRPEGEEEPTKEDDGSEATEGKASKPQSELKHESKTTGTFDLSSKPPGSGKYATLATPAVRHLCKEHGLDITDIQGTGKEGRVMKEDVHNHLSSRGSSSSAEQDMTPASRSAVTEPVTEDRSMSLTPVQSAMLKTMTKSLAIPHFLYSDTLDVTTLNSLRQGLNSANKDKAQKLSALPFFIKAISLALAEFPIINARLDTTNQQKPQLVYRAAHNIGIAVDTPNGLLVPVIRNVERLSISAIAAEAKRLASLAQEGKLSSSDLSGGTFSVSNVGSIGGGVVSPVIVEGQMGIVGIGRSKAVPAFDAGGIVVRREECTMSWSADHRVIDGATIARAAEFVKQLLENPAHMVVRLR